MPDRNRPIPPLDGPYSPEETRRVAELAAEAIRYLDYATRHHEALKDPSDADRVIRELSSAAGRVPQLLGQLAARIAAWQVMGMLTVPAGEYAGRPDLAAATVKLRLDAASALLEMAYAELERAASVTSALAVREGGGDE